MKDSDEELGNLLSNDAPLDATAEPQPRRKPLRQRIYTRPCSTSYLILIHLILLFSIVFNVYLLSAGARAPSEGARTIFPELRHLGKVLVRSEYDFPEHGGKNNSEFDGVPSNGTGWAWNKLLRPFYIEASEKEVREAGFATSVLVKLKSGGYLASLGVYVEAHCLNQLRNLLYNRTPIHEDTLSPLSADELRYYHAHLDHCIEILRVSVTCAADLSLYTYTWPANASSLMWLDAHGRGERVCGDFERIAEWAGERAVGMSPRVVGPG